MKILVNIKNYTNFTYHPYLRHNTPIDIPENPTYVVGQVVVIPDENSDEKNRLALAVVLGCIDEVGGELRTDVHGMVCMDKIRPATINDFGSTNIRYIERLKKECQGEPCTTIHEHKTFGGDRQESLWFHGKQIATVRKEGRTFIVEATGEQRIYVDKSGKGNFEDLGRHDGEFATKKAIDAGLLDKDLLNGDKVLFEMNSWFAIRELDENGEISNDDVAICHTYDEAIEQAENLI